MSAKKISLARGVVLTCDGCGERVQTANIRLAANRTWASVTFGWIRGGRGVRERKDRSRDPDYCAACATAELERVATLKLEAEAKRKAREKKRRIEPQEAQAEA